MPTISGERQTTVTIGGQRTTVTTLGGERQTTVTLAGEVDSYTPGPPSTGPRLDFSIATNSMYLALF